MAAVWSGYSLLLPRTVKVANSPPPPPPPRLHPWETEGEGERERSKPQINLATSPRWRERERERDCWREKKCIVVVDKNLRKKDLRQFFFSCCFCFFSFKFLGFFVLFVFFFFKCATETLESHEDWDQLYLTFPPPSPLPLRLQSLPFLGEEGSSRFSIWLDAAAAAGHQIDSSSSSNNATTTAAAAAETNGMSPPPPPQTDSKIEPDLGRKKNPQSFWNWG